MSRSKSIAIWLEKESDNDVAISLHANLWRFRQLKGRCKHIFDIGILFDASEEEQNICIYLPTTLDKENDIEDLGVHFQKAKLANAVFNECGSTRDEESLWITVRKPNDDVKVRIIEKRDITVTEEGDGTIIRFKIPPLNEDGTKAYIRVRFKNIIDDLFIESYQPKDSFFKSSFKTIETVDFRVNEKRNIPKRLNEIVNVWPTFTKTHLLCMVNSEDELVFNDKPVSVSRSIEEDLWGDYLEPYSPNDMIAYHWKTEGCSDVNTLVKFQTHSHNKKTIVKYFLWIIIIALLCDLLYDGMKIGLPKAWNKVKEIEFFDE